MAQRKMAMGAVMAVMMEELTTGFTLVRPEAVAFVRVLPQYQRPTT